MSLPSFQESRVEQWFYGKCGEPELEFTRTKRGRVVYYGDLKDSKRPNYVPRSSTNGAHGLRTSTNALYIPTEGL